MKFSEQEIIDMAQGHLDRATTARGEYDWDDGTNRNGGPDFPDRERIIKLSEIQSFALVSIAASLCVIAGSKHVENEGGSQDA